MSPPRHTSSSPIQWLGKGSNRSLTHSARVYRPARSCTLSSRFPNPCNQFFLAERARGRRAGIAIGGDGTVAAATTAVHGFEIPATIIPSGFTNVIARSFRIPRIPVVAVNLAFGHHLIRTIDVGLCHGRRFLHMGGACFDSHMLDAICHNFKRRLGWVASLQGASKSILVPAVRFSIEVDGMVVECASPLGLLRTEPQIAHPCCASTQIFVTTMVLWM